MTVAEGVIRPYLEPALGFDGVTISTLGAIAGGETVVASDETAARLAEIQLDLGEGPAWVALREQRGVAVADLTARPDRWPLFAAAAAGSPARSLYACPLGFADVTVGVVEVYAREPRTLSAAVEASVQRQTRATFFEVMALMTVDADSEQTSNPLSRRVVHQATGMILSRFRLAPHDALVLLRAHAFRLGRPVIEVADDIVNRRSDFLASTIEPEDQSW